MKKIYKFPLNITDSQKISIDWDAKLLSVQMQENALTLWALVRTTNGTGYKTIRIFGTEHEIPDGLHLSYIGTVQDSYGGVWHVFEETL